MSNTTSNPTASMGPAGELPTKAIALLLYLVGFVVFVVMVALTPYVIKGNLVARVDWLLLFLANPAIFWGLGSALPPVVRVPRVFQGFVARLRGVPLRVDVATDK